MLRIFAVLFCFAYLHPTWAAPAEEIGKATYYADRLKGRKTASGEKYNPQMLTCAHKTYAFGTKLRVTNLENKESVIVKVNDRGPFVEGYVVDLSRHAAKALNMLDDGVAKVRVERVEDREIVVNPAPTAYSTPQSKAVASYYSDANQGKKTASGEKYDANLLTCAHNEHPFGTKLRVTNLKNNKSVEVRVNDRLKSGGKSTIDLSRRAAEKISMIDAGRVPVRIDVVGQEKETRAETPMTAQKTDQAKVVVLKPAQEEASAATKKVVEKPAAPAKEAAKPIQYSEVTGKDFKNSDLYALSLKRPLKKGFGVQVGVFTNAAAILHEVAKLQGSWDGKVLVAVENADSEEKATYKLIVGPYGDRKAADQVRTNAAKKGYSKAFVVDLSEEK